MLRKSGSFGETNKMITIKLNFINEMIKIIHPINQILKISLTSARNV
jgi:hypothetical protein